MQGLPFPRTAAAQSPLHGFSSSHSLCAFKGPVYLSPTTKVRLTPLPASSSSAFSAETALPHHDMGGMEFNSARKLHPSFSSVPRTLSFPLKMIPECTNMEGRRLREYHMLCEQNCDSFLDNVDVGQCIFLRKHEICTVLPHLDQF